MAKEKMSTKKKASAVVAGVLAVALAVGGAYAYTDYSQNATNTLYGQNQARVLLHDDFNGENKDVYVENTGDSEAYVRVKFAEYLQVGNTVILTDPNEPSEKADPNDVSTWTVHAFQNEDPDDNSCGKQPHNYFQWKMTGAQKGYLAGVTESDGEGLGGLGTITAEPGDTVTVGDITTTYQETAAQRDIVMLSTWNDLYTEYQSDNTFAGDADKLALWTNINAGCWLLDTDGWAYWSVKLQPGTATNLLLDAVVPEETEDGRKVAPSDNWVYNIDVQLQAATPADIDAWFADGKAVVASADNQVATVTDNGYDFIYAKEPGAFNVENGTTMGRDGGYFINQGSGVYAVATLNADGTGYEETTKLVLAGQDGKLETEDDDMLAGRSAENGGGIAVKAINLTTDPDNPYYTLDGTSDDDIHVTAGIDKRLGTYDDVITSVAGDLGQYEIDKEPGADNVGWNYLGGSLSEMLVTTEYVLDNTVFNSSGTGKAAYAGSTLQSKITTIGNTLDMNMGYTVVKKDVDMSDAQHTGNAVYVCTTAGHKELTDDHSKTSSCSAYQHTAYYTTVTGQADITTDKYFALSLKEVLDAYGDSTDAAVRVLRKAQAAPMYVHETPGQGGGNFNYNDSTSWKDGDGNAITTTHYWLRSPGYDSTRAALVNRDGYVGAYYGVNTTHVGARPACYLNLSSHTS